MVDHRTPQARHVVTIAGSTGSAPLLFRKATASFVDAKLRQAQVDSVKEEWTTTTVVRTTRGFERVEKRQ